MNASVKNTKANGESWDGLVGEAPDIYLELGSFKSSVMSDSTFAEWNVSAGTFTIEELRKHAIWIWDEDLSGREQIGFCTVASNLNRPEAKRYLLNTAPSLEFPVAPCVGEIIGLAIELKPAP